MRRSKSAGGGVVLLIASVGCFPDYSGLSDGPPRDASGGAGGGGAGAGGASGASGASADVTVDVPGEDRTSGDERPLDTSSDCCDSAFDVSDVRDASDAPDTPIDPCARAGSPDGVYVTSPRGAYCIDPTEVTVGAYLAFMTAKPNWGPADQPSYCSWNTSLQPAGAVWPRPGEEQFPVAVDWCDAWSYCKWAGKRLCGQIGGGPLAEIFATDARSQWYHACAGDAPVDGAPPAAYPYGNMYDPRRCNGVESQTPPAIREVSTARNCVGHYPGLFDMSGNLFEWIDSCVSYTGADDSCRMMGGGYTSPIYELTCDYRALNPRNHLVDNIGFRCCADVSPADR
jgi:formylglycine-generating enzyme required for sulfatase activity